MFFLQKFEAAEKAAEEAKRAKELQQKSESKWNEVLAETKLIWNSVFYFIIFGKYKFFVEKFEFYLIKELG